jgi:hypothetical protein
MAARPKAHNETQAKEFERLDNQFKETEANLKNVTQDELNKAPRMEHEPQTKIAAKDQDKVQDLYLKPSVTFGSKEKFNEKFRDDYNFAKEYVYFIAENFEIIGETIEIWTKPFPGCPAEFWKVPVNKPLYGPRYLAEQIKKCNYHRLVMKDVNTGVAREGTFFGQMAADTTIPRLDARPATTKRSVFMGASSF